MPKKQDFDINAAHRHFSAHCFNEAWSLIDKPKRTPEEDEEMIRLSLASLWHWTQRKDCTKENQSIGHWQTSRIYAMLGQAENARRYGELSMSFSKGDDVPPFCLAYAHEALARAESIAGNRTKMAGHLRAARQVAETIKDEGTKKQLLADLKTIV